jgi:hypothetical protein
MREMGSPVLMFALLSDRGFRKDIGDHFVMPPKLFIATINMHIQLTILSAFICAAHVII